MPDEFFLRFRWSDADALAHEIVAAEGALLEARAAGNAHGEIEASCRLANAFTAADREKEAVALLRPLPAIARGANHAADLAWVLHHLATAEQYCGDREAAQVHFAEALDVVTIHPLPEVEHFIWHHRGRCYAEQGAIGEARRCFEKALTIRERLGDPRAEKSRQAVAVLDALTRPPSSPT
jgi:tetratricopeptide (TPR) repeat protein